jgi:endonuclease YncB( thermonuclease family)
MSYNYKTSYIMFCCFFRRIPSFKYSNDEYEMFIPNIKYAKVIRVYDGDTITIGTVLSGHPYRFSVRLREIDTPEMRHRNPKHKECGRIVRDIVSHRLMGQTVLLSDVCYDKYGRILAHVSLVKNGRVDPETISEWLLREKFAIPYGGGTKDTMTDEFFEHILSLKDS